MQYVNMMKKIRINERKKNLPHASSMLSDSLLELKNIS